MDATIELTLAQLDEWLRRYGQAWESLDPKAMVELFTEDVLYEETPFQTHMRGHSELHEYIAKAGDFQRDVRFGFKTLATNPAVAHWWASYKRVADGGETKLDGIFLLEFSTDGRCQSLKEWWHAEPFASF